MTQRASLLVLMVLGACSVFSPEFTATSGVDGDPVTVRVALEGADNIAGRTLLRAVEDYMLDLSSDPSREAAVYDAALELQDLYQRYGYPEATVTYRYTPPPADRREPVTVTFVVSEGPLVVVPDVAIDGNQAFDDERLLTLWSRRTTGTLALGDPVYVESEIRGLAESIQAFYQGEGYLDAQVSPPQIERVAVDRMRVAIQVIEGPVHRVAKVDVEPALADALGGNLPPSIEGQVFTRRLLQEYEIRVRSRLRERGHPDPRIEARVVLHERPEALIDVRVAGVPGPVAAIGEILITGNDKTWTWFIRNKLHLEEGMRYDGSEVDEALRRLYLSGLFSKVEVTHEWLDWRRVRIRIAVEETESRSAEFLVGYGSYERLRGAVRLEDANLLGTGRDLTLDLRASERGYRTAATWTNPDFLTEGTTLSVGGEHFRREEPAFTDKAVGGTVALSRRFGGNLTGRVGYTYLDHVDARADSRSFGNDFVDYAEGRVFTEIRNDDRDNLLFPKSGHVEFLTLERMAPELAATVDFARVRFGAAGFVPLGRSASAVFRAETGFLFPEEGSARVPLQERFYNGGEGTVRSFRESQLGPKDAEGEPIGGEFRNVFSVELRFPLISLLEGALFVDAGNVGREIQDYGLDDMRYGIGAGVRWLLPIGPVRVDGGWNPDRELGEREWAVHLSVGYPF